LKKIIYFFFEKNLIHFVYFFFEKKS
jgi:hypothetical protein